MAVNIRSVIWIDAGGRTRQTIITTTTSAGAEALRMAMAAKSNAVPFEYWEGLPIFPYFGPSPIAAPYADVVDVATLLFSAADGTRVKLTLPGPVQSLFLGDQQTVDPAQASGIIAAAIGILLSASSSPASAFVGGVRSRGRERGF